MRERASSTAHTSLTQVWRRIRTSAWLITIMTPSSIYMRGQGGLEWQADLSTTSNLQDTSSSTHVPHMLNSLLPSDTCQAPRWWRSTSKSPRHEHYFLWSNASPPRSEVSIHFQRRAFLRTITPTCPLHQLNCPKVKCKSPCKLPINPMVSRAQCLLQHGWCSSKARHPPSKQPPSICPLLVTWRSHQAP